MQVVVCQIDNSSFEEIKMEGKGNGYPIFFAEFAPD